MSFNRALVGVFLHAGSLVTRAGDRVCSLWNAIPPFVFGLVIWYVIAGVVAGTIVVIEEARTGRLPASTLEPFIACHGDRDCLVYEFPSLIAYTIARALLWPVEVARYAKLGLVNAYVSFIIDACKRA